MGDDLMFRTQQQWRDLFNSRDIYLECVPSPEDAHFELSSGQHSTGFIQGRAVIADSLLFDEALSDLVEKLAARSAIGCYVDVIAGPARGATEMARRLAKRFQQWTEPLSVSIVRGDVTLTPGEQGLVHGKKVLLCDDVTTTGRSVATVARAINAAGGSIAPFVLTFVRRTDQLAIDGRTIIALDDRQWPLWSRADCPHCKEGSPAISQPEDIMPMQMAQA